MFQFSVCKRIFGSRTSKQVIFGSAKVLELHNINSYPYNVYYTCCIIMYKIWFTDIIYIIIIIRDWHEIRISKMQIQIWIKFLSGFPELCRFSGFMIFFWWLYVTLLTIFLVYDKICYFINFYYNENLTINKFLSFKISLILEMHLKFGISMSENYVI